MKTSQRHPWLAVLLQFGALGLGQLYNGEPYKMFLAWALIAACGTLYPYAVLTSRFGIVLMALGIVVGLALFGVFLFDAYRVARRHGESYVLRRYNRVLVYVGIALGFTFARQSLNRWLNEHVAQIYLVTSNAMSPALGEGDAVWMDVRDSAFEPRRGDVVVYASPHDEAGHTFIARVIGLPGDRIQIRDKQLRIGRSAMREAYAHSADSVVWAASRGPRDQFGPLRVPQGSYFLLTDDRDFGNDSRFIGPIDSGYLLGRATWVCGSWDPETAEWRWERVGRRAISELPTRMRD